MKRSLIFVSLLFPLWSTAQTIDVNNVDANSEGSTTIEITKNKKDSATAAAPKWEVQDGEADVEGESSATGRDAKAAWKKACKDWKTEIRNDNKENKVLSLNCGTVSCGGDAGSKVCSSKATYKIKTKVE